MQNNKLTYIDNIPSTLELRVNEGEKLHLEFASFSSLGNINIHAIVEKDGQLDASFADFSCDSGKVVVNVELNGEGAELTWNLASLAKAKEKKEFVPSVYHNAPHTKALMKNYGITRDESQLFFFGESVIPHGSVKTSTRQEAKVIVFDPLCKGKASPVLKISENDVEASHGAALGRLNESHLFYLMSRGLNLEEAKRLVTLGYLKPIEDHFDDENVRKRIDSAIEGGI